MQDTMQTIVETLDGKHNRKLDDLDITPDQYVKACYLTAARQPCFICASKRIHVVAKYPVPERLQVTGRQFVLYPLCGNCKIDPNHQAKAETKIVEAIRRESGQGLIQVVQ